MRAAISDPERQLLAIDDVLRCQAISVRVRLLRHAGEVLRLYVLRDRS